MDDVRCAVLGAALAVALVMTSALPALSGPSPAVGTALTLHAPISILGNADFTPANGVVGGIGTASSPYVIAGWSIDAPPSMGVQIRDTDAYAVVENVVVTGAPTAGFYAFGASNLTFSNVTSLGSAGDGIRIESSQNVAIEGSNVTANNNGVAILDSVQVGVRANNVTLNRADGVAVSTSTNVLVQANVIAYGGVFGGYGLDLASSLNTTVIGNRFTGDGIYLEGTSAAHFTSHRITADNLISGLPVLYVSNQTGYTVSGLGLGELILAGCSNSNVLATTVEGGDIGMEVAYSTSIDVRNVTISDAYTGLLVVSSRYVTFDSGAILDTGVGVSVVSSQYVQLDGSKISAPFSTTAPGDGVAVLSSDHVWVIKNVIRRHVDGVSVSASSNVTTNLNVISMDARGLWYHDSRDLLAFENQFVQDATGAEVDRITNGTFILNMFEGLPLGANASDSSQLRFFSNVFLGNALDAHDTNGSVNAWDDGYPTGGNYWPNYTGLDACSGPLQNNCTGPDGFGDTPFRFDVNATDHFPLMKPLNLGDVPPEALFYTIPAVGSVITTFQASANLSSDYEDPLSALQVRWDWEGNGTWTPWTIEKFASHTYTVPGTHRMTLEVKDLANLTDTWTTPLFVAPKPDNLPPAISIMAPSTVNIGQPITVVANITDASGVASAAVDYFGVDGGSFVFLPMSLQVNGANFTATIPAQPRAGTLIFAIIANDTWENEARAPLGGYISVTVVDPLVTLISTLAFPLAVVSIAAVAFLVWYWRRRGRAQHAPAPPPPPEKPPSERPPDNP